MDRRLTILAFTLGLSACTHVGETPGLREALGR